MYSAHRRTLAVVFLVAPFLSGTAAFPQRVSLIHHSADPLALATLPLGRGPCFGEAGSTGTVVPAATNKANAGLDSTCDTPPVRVPSVNPCNPGALAQGGCYPPGDLAQENLEALGKTGRRILPGRERVLEILQSENACSAWFREKDSNPAATFRTLSFAIDGQGEEFVQESQGAGGMKIIRNPYVARVFQADGSYATVTINANGAFFASMAGVREVKAEGGPQTVRRGRMLRVGPYTGNSLHAQVLALLHEFGHVVDLLPADGGDQEAKSVQNTAEVLRFCRAEIESKVKRESLQAAK
jgi:hypothetical protein